MLGRRIFGLAPEGNGERLWISDTDNHRVLRIRDPLTNPVVDVILGQRNASGHQCNHGRFPAVDRTAIESGLHNDVLCFPGALSIDRLGNLYVSDHSLEIDGNRRLLVFPPSVTRSSGSQVVFGPHATKAFLRSGQGPDNLWGDGRNRTAVMRLKRFGSGPLTAATWEPAFDSTNRMVVGYNAYAGTGFVGVYDDPLGPETFPTSLLYDFGSMPYTAAFDENDNLYVGDINRARVLLYFNPFGSPSQSSTELSDSIPPAPHYPVEIRGVSPEPPYCVVRHSTRSYETTLELTADGIGNDRATSLQFRRVTDFDREGVDVHRSELEVKESRVSIDSSEILLHRWQNRKKVTMTVRIIEGDGEPLSSWSPAFVLADDVETCGNALPSPTPTFTPTPTLTATPSPSPTLTPTAEATPTPTYTPTLTPTHTPTPTQAPSFTPTTANTPTPSPIPTPTGTPTPSPISTPISTPTPSPIPTPTGTPTPSPIPTPTQTPTITRPTVLGLTATHTATTIPTRTPLHTATFVPTGIIAPTSTSTVTPTLTPVPTQAATATASVIPMSHDVSTIDVVSTPTVHPQGNGCTISAGRTQPGLELTAVLLLLLPLGIVVWNRRR